MPKHSPFDSLNHPDDEFSDDEDPIVERAKARAALSFKISSRLAAHMFG
jgi:hypothetical protein